MEIIKKNNQIISIIYRDSDWIPGLNFITPNSLFVQAGSWWYNKGQILDNHIHTNYERTGTRTQEMVYVKKGSMKCFLFTEKKVFFKEFILKEGDLAVFAFGGHGFEILEDDTKIIEAKNGPFTSVEKDKVKF
tara:strand:+ start:3322 stop:3720 length:399 start_codon:yes stop_codon:yes gene_type:complete